MPAEVRGAAAEETGEPEGAAHWAFGLLTEATAAAAAAAALAGEVLAADRGNIAPWTRSCWCNNCNCMLFIIKLLRPF